MAQTAVKQISYIFEGCGGVRDQLEQTILNELQAAKYPLPATIKYVKAGRGWVGALAGSKEQCVVVDIQDEYSVNIASTTVGTFLYVCIYLMVPSFGLKAAVAGSQTNWADQIGDVFKLQKINASYAAAVSCAESAFENLNLKQANRGYKREEH